MEVIPAIDIRGGLCVRLEQGDYARETVFGDDPAAMARRWQEAGVPRIHVVDLDGAREGRPVNEEAVRSILSAVSVPVQLGGGVRDLSAVERCLSAGVGRVVLGTAAVKNPEVLVEAVSLYRERVVVGVDARDGIVATEGWMEASGVPVGELVRRLSEAGVRRVIYTDIARDGMMSGPNIGALAALLEETAGLPSPVAVIASGGVSSPEHVRRLASVGVEGVIVGRALYTGALDLREALQAASSRT